MTRSSETQREGAKRATAIFYRGETPFSCHVVDLI